MKHEQPYWKCRTVSEINNLVVDFYNPIDFLNFGESMLSASVDQELYKLMFTGSNNLFGSFIDRDLDFAVLYMVDPKQSRVTGGWTIDGHIDMELKIYRIKVMHALKWIDSSAGGWEVQDNGWVYNGNTSKNTTLQCVYWQLNYKFDPNNEASGYTRKTDQYNQVLGGSGCVITGYMIRGLKGY